MNRPNIAASSGALASLLLMLWLGGEEATSAPVFSIDWDSQQAVGGFVDEGDLLVPQGTGQFPSPSVFTPFGSAGLGLAPTALGIHEVDALSYGKDARLTQSQSQQWSFSVDQYAQGLPGVPAFSVTTEGANGNQQAAGDIYYTVTTPGPLAVSNGINTGSYDGDANLTPPFLAPGLNLREPTPPLVPQVNDNLDALDLEGPGASNYPVYFSLDSSFVDPFTGIPNSGSAAANGFSGGDVLVTTVPGGPPSLYASAGFLGLNLNGVPDSDDLDALVLWENGDGIFQIPTSPYSWLGPNPTDMMLFSVRRGSNLIGTLDSLLGIAITEGDILLPLALQVPGIFVPAENLGLFARFPGVTNDELDALDVQFFQTIPPSHGEVPEPSSLTLLMLGGLALLKSKRPHSKFERMTVSGPRHSSKLSRRCFSCIAQAAAIFVLGLSSFASIARAATYDFLTVTGNGIAGNLATSQFTSPNGYGVINVTHSFSQGGAGLDDNNNPLIFPSQFTTLFPGTGQVQGHLAQTVYDHTSVVTFDLTGYALSPTTVFGMWNTSDQVSQPAYRVELINSINNPVAPATFNLIGNQDNIAPLARHKMVLNTATGNITAGALLNNFGTHTDAAFWDNIPNGTKKIIVYGNLGPLNPIGDGVGYYFAEKVPAPEPSSMALLLCGGTLLVTRRRRCC